MGLNGVTDAELANLSKEELLEMVQKSKKGNVRFKIGAKGGISVYGLGQRFPATLYASSWLLVLDNAEALKAFIEEHKSELAEEK